MRSAFFFLSVAAALLNCAGTWSQDNETQKPFGLEPRKPWTSSKLVGTPEPPPPYTVRRIFPEIVFKSPVFIAQEPGTDRMMVGELDGKIWAFPISNPVPDAKELVLETKRQLYSFSFHTNYEQNGQIFVFSPTDPEDKSEDKRSRVSRFQMNLDHPRRTSLEHETVIVEWPAGGHNGGEAIIGPDGYLYVSTGDSTSGSDIKETGQGVDDLLSVMMRLDVDHPDEGKAYSIPPDNPFVNFPGARPEIWAYGFRNPWRFSFDKSGRLWCGDVGQDLWEMIWLVEKGGNYGWSVQEGSHPFHPGKKAGPGPILPPVVEHHHTECRSITGGYLYEGSLHPELNGVYFYGDYEYGMIWGFRYDGTKATEQRVLADTALRIPTFGISRKGEILLMDHPSGELYELVPAPAAEANQQFPRQLSETGLFDSVGDHALASGVMPYSVTAPQWIDNGRKQRFVALPGESKAVFSETGAWSVEDGTVLAETISLDMEEGQPESQRRIETRILLRQQSHWLGYSYLWNEAQTDATLVESSGRDVVLNIRAAASGRSESPDGTRRQTWHIPSRSECMFCHSRAAEFVLGFRTSQLNCDHDYAGISDNQLRAFEHAAVFNAPLPKPPSELPVLTSPYDDTGDLQLRARTWLHVNCSVCHVVDGGGNARIVLSLETKNEDMKLISEKPIHGDFGLTGSALITPGDPWASVLFYRLSKTGRGHMPHVGSQLQDPVGLKVVREWITQLPRPETTGAAEPPTSDSASLAVVDQLRQRQLTGDQGDQALDQLLQSNREAFMLAGLVVDSTTSDSLRTRAIARGVAHRDPNIRDLFERFIPEESRTRTLGDPIDPQLVLGRTGDIERGRDLFQNASSLQCRNCHRLNNTGGTLGADLSQVGKRLRRNEILESLIDPSKKIDPKFQTQLVVRTDGKVLTGIVTEKNDLEILLSVLQEGRSEQLRVPLAEIEELVPQTRSLMPDKLLRDLTAQEAADLLAFLTSLQ